MGVLMLKCSTIGPEFSTGIQVDEASLKTLPDVVTRSDCPHWGLTHNWRTRDARYADAIPPTQWVETVDRKPRM